MKLNDPHRTKTLGAALLAAIAFSGLAVPEPAIARVQEGEEAPAPATEDILYLHDGRELHGRIIEESRHAIVFELVQQGSGIRSKMTVLRSEISTIERGVATSEPVVTVEAAAPPPVKKDADEEAATFGARRAVQGDSDAPSFYIVPMKGQFGTDVTPSIYKEMVEDIRASKPDYLIITVDCRDYEDQILYNDIERPEQSFASIDMIDSYRELVNLFRDDLRDIKQCVWVKDSVGISSAVLFAWPEFYMAPTARLGGISDAAKRDFPFEEMGDQDKVGKMREAYMAFLRGFAEYSDVVPEVIDAMVRPTFMLSGSWSGRTVKWRSDREGQYIVDQSDESTAAFRAKAAEDLCLSDGTAENLDDLALLLGFREYRVIDGAGERMFDEYVTDWRRRLQQAKDLLEEYQEIMANVGRDPLQYLGRAKQTLRKVVAAIDQYKAVEVRLAMETGATKFALETRIEEIEEQIKAMRRGGGAAGGGAGGGGAGPGSGGG